jgi:hypothetical protein
VSLKGEAMDVREEKIIESRQRHQIPGLITLRSKPTIDMERDYEQEVDERIIKDGLIVPLSVKCSVNIQYLRPANWTAYMPINNSFKPT